MSSNASLIHASHRHELSHVLRVVSFFALAWLVLANARVPVGAWMQASYTAAHSILEVLSVVVAGIVFAIAWHTPAHQATRKSVLVGCLFLGVAVLDVSHLLSFPGMPQFVTPSDVSKGIQFWLAARIMAGAGLLAAALMADRASTDRAFRAASLGGVGVVLLAVHGAVFFAPSALPAVFVPGVGLTPLKVGVEYALAGTYLLAAVLFLRRLKRPRETSDSAFLAAALLMAMSELFLTLYRDVTDVVHMAGHIYKIAAYYFLYRALFLDSMARPYQRLDDSLAELQATLKALPDLMFEVDEDGRYLSVHTSQEQLLAKERHAFLGRRVTDVIPPAAAAVCMEAIAEAMREGTSRGRQYQLEVPGGRLWFELSIARQPLVAGRKTRLIVIARDITKRVLHEQALRKKADLNTALLALRDELKPGEPTRWMEVAMRRAMAITSSPIGFFALASADGKRLEHACWVGQEGLAGHYSGQAMALAAGDAWSQAVHERRSVTFDAYHPLPMAPGLPLQLGRIDRWLSVPVFDGGALRMVAGMGNAPDAYADADVEAVQLVADAALRNSQKQAANERIDHLSRFDQLTGLPNRSALEDRLRFALAQARRMSYPVALVWMDVDAFKSVNESLGHAAGDALLREVAQRLRAVVADHDSVARISGDKFAAVLAGADQNAAAAVATELLKALAVPLVLEGYELVTTASIGLALYPDDGSSVEDLLRCAEAAMYRVKNDSRNGFRFYAPEMQESTTRALHLTNALKLAIARDELRLVFQPQVSLATGELAGAEALLRWRHPQLGNISPAEFIPLAEGSGLINQIGEWVLRRTLNQLTEWRRRGVPLLKVAINLSAAQFSQPQFAQSVAAMLADADIPGTLVEMELTEAATMKDADAAQVLMDELAALGLTLAIDDFGIGYSSLSHLKRFTAHKLKVDQSFVRQLGEDPGDRAIVHTIIQMAHNLGMETLAEGVETAGQLRILRELGCDQVQGYFYSRPLEVGDYEAFVRERPRLAED